MPMEKITHTYNKESEMSSGVSTCKPSAPKNLAAQWDVQKHKKSVFLRPGYLLGKNQTTP